MLVYNYLVLKTQITTERDETTTGSDDCIKKGWPLDPEEKTLSWKSRCCDAEPHWTTWTSHKEREYFQLKGVIMGYAWTQHGDIYSRHSLFVCLFVSIGAPIIIYTAAPLGGEADLT